MSDDEQKEPTQAEVEAMELRNMMLTLLDIEAARHLFLLLFEKCNFLGTSFAPENAFQTAYNEGLRFPAIWLKDSIEAASPGAFGRLLAEAYLIEEKKNGRQQSESAADAWK